MWAAEGAALYDKSRRQHNEGERLLDDARAQLPKISETVSTLRMYLEYLKLARRQIELEREFGLGAFSTPQTLRGGKQEDRVCAVGGANGRQNYNSVVAAAGSCGLEVRSTAGATGVGNYGSSQMLCAQRTMQTSTGCCSRIFLALESTGWVEVQLPHCFTVFGEHNKSLFPHGRLRRLTYHIARARGVSGTVPRLMPVAGTMRSSWYCCFMQDAR